MKEEQQTIPHQYEGKRMDLEANILLEDVNHAKDFYTIVKNRLLRAYDWHKIAKVPATTFRLTNQQGNEILREMRENDILQIDIPGPGGLKSSGYDWVSVETIFEGTTEEGEYCSITLRPTSNPKYQDEEIAHFFKSIATSTLLVKRDNLNVSAEYHGRNELVNKDTTRFTDKIRNIVVGLVAQLGLSYTQWQSLINGLIVNDKKTKFRQ